MVTCNFTKNFTANQSKIKTVFVFANANVFYMYMCVAAKSNMTSSKSMSGSTSNTSIASRAGHMTLQNRLPLTPARPKVNSLLHLFGAWLVEASIAGVKVYGSEKSGTRAGSSVGCLLWLVPSSCSNL